MSAHDIVFSIHIVISTAFSLVAITVTVWAVIGWMKRLPSNKIFDRLSFVFIHLLYLQLLTGIGLYFFLRPADGAGILTIEEAVEYSNLRFWAIEHVSLMLFATILAQTGRILIKQMQKDYRKYRASTLYLGVSFLVVIASVAMVFIR